MSVMQLSTKFKKGELKKVKIVKEEKQERKSKKGVKTLIM